MRSLPIAFAVLFLATGPAWSQQTSPNNDVFAPAPSAGNDNLFNITPASPTSLASPGSSTLRVNDSAVSGSAAELTANDFVESYDELRDVHFYFSKKQSRLTSNLPFASYVGKAGADAPYLVIVLNSESIEKIDVDSVYVWADGMRFKALYNISQNYRSQSLQNPARTRETVTLFPEAGDLDLWAKAARSGAIKVGLYGPYKMRVITLTDRDRAAFADNIDLVSRRYR